MWKCDECGEVSNKLLICWGTSEGHKVDVIDYFCRSYLRGETPNPCVVCNERFKFGRLLGLADVVGAEGVAAPSSDTPGGFASSPATERVVHRGPRKASWPLCRARQARPRGGCPDVESKRIKSY